ncbi:MAG: DNA adenine methylase [Chloroflexi bacterium]|nr:DNA adenine methylase [Chloroflexota bacterium]
MTAYQPFLKWAGGKSSLLPQYEPLLPKGGVRAYFEPFVGSGAVFFYLRSKEAFAENWHLSDANPELLNVYRAVRDQLPELLAELRVHRQQHSKDHYYSVRAWDRNGDWSQIPPVQRAARMLYLNRTCYNGLWRVNQRGQFNVPMGRYDKPRIVNAARLRAAHKALQGVSLRVTHFRAVLERAAPGDFVYFDPPYVPLNATANFTEYSRYGFSTDDQRELAEVFRALADRGCRVMLSNSDTPLVHELYADFRIERVHARRSINVNADRRGAITEVVVLSYHL